MCVFYVIWRDDSDVFQHCVCGDNCDDFHGVYRCEQWHDSVSGGCAGQWGGGDDVFQHCGADGGADAVGGSDLRQFVDQHVFVFVCDVDAGSLLVEFRAGVYCELNGDVCVFVHVGWEHSHVVQCGGECDHFDVLRGVYGVE